MSCVYVEGTCGLCERWGTSGGGGCFGASVCGAQRAAVDVEVGASAFFQES